MKLDIVIHAVVEECKGDELKDILEQLTTIMDEIRGFGSATGQVEIKGDTIISI